MSNNEELLKQVEQQEANLMFEEFTSETALKIGLRIVDRAKKENLPITVDIRRHGQQLFHYAFEGTSPDNDRWVLLKSHVVDRMNISSLHLRLSLEQAGQTPADRLLDPFDFAASGGAFPVKVRNVGVVGSIAVSGLLDTDDHALVVWAIEQTIAEH